MNREQKAFDWFCELMDNRPFTGILVFFSSLGVLGGIVALIIWVFGGWDDGTQEQINFVNSCNSAGKVATLQYEEVRVGKSYEWRPIVRCKGGMGA